MNDDEPANDLVDTATSRPETEALPPGWSRPLPDTLPEPTYWPAALALGITLFAWGLVTTFIISGAGLILAVLALSGWIGDIRHEQRGS
jgi:hypothetical protein